MPLHLNVITSYKNFSMGSFIVQMGSFIVQVIIGFSVSFDENTVCICLSWTGFRGLCSLFSISLACKAACVTFIIV